MPKTLRINEITAADRPFIFSANHGDGTVTLYYAGEQLPVFDIPPKNPVVSQYAFRLLLEQRRLTNSFEQAVGTLPADEQIRIKWMPELARRDTVAIKALLLAGLTERDIDTLFDDAAGVNTSPSATLEPAKPKK